MDTCVHLPWEESGLGRGALSHNSVLTEQKEILNAYFLFFFMERKIGHTIRI